jgi:Cu/Ag efflux protein CusF
MKTALKAAGLLVCAFPVALVVGAKDNPDTYPFAKGIIAKLDLPAGRITLKTEHGPRAFDFTPRTYIFRGKEKLTPDKLKLGDSIKLNYYTNDLGHALLRRIKVDLPESPQ